MCRFRMFECSLWSRRLTDTFSYLPYIPRDAKQRSRWCNRIKRQHGKDGFFVTNSTVVSSKHFRKEDVRNSLTGRRFLVPSLLFVISRPSHLQGKSPGNEVEIYVASVRCIVFVNVSITCITSAYIIATPR